MKGINTTDSIFLRPSHKYAHSLQNLIHMSHRTVKEKEACQPSDLNTGLPWVLCKFIVVRRGRGAEQEAQQRYWSLSLLPMMSRLGKGHGDWSMGTLQKAGKARMALAIPRMVAP